MRRRREAKLEYWLLCDAVRREDNGKLIIVGMYPVDIGVPAVPVTLPMLSFLLRWNLKPGPLRDGAIVLKGPARKRIAEIPIKERVFGEAQQTGYFLFGISPFHIEQLGTFTLLYASGNRSKRLGSFKVILQESAAQKG